MWAEAKRWSWYFTTCACWKVSHDRDAQAHGHTHHTQSLNTHMDIIDASTAIYSSPSTRLNVPLVPWNPSTLDNACVKHVSVSGCWSTRYPDDVGCWLVLEEEEIPLEAWIRQLRFFDDSESPGRQKSSALFFENTFTSFSCQILRISKYNSTCCEVHSSN